MNSTLASPSAPERFRELAYVRYGQGRPVIALHGFGQTSYAWRHLVFESPDELALYVFDLRGCGSSAKPHDEHYAMQDQADLICAFIQERDLRDVTLIGHSMGGGIALLAALKLLKQQGRLCSLVLVDCAAFPQRLPLFVRVMRQPLLCAFILACLPPRLLVEVVMRQAFHDHRKIDDEAVRVYSRNLASPEGRYALLKTAQQLIPADVDRIIANYKRIHVPTLIVWGSDDRIISLKNGVRLKKAIPNSQLLTLPACGHIPHEEQPNVAIPVIHEFLADARNQKAAICRPA